MAHAKGSHPGTIWHKTDFQCHTPRDRNWAGPTNLPGTTDAEHAARVAWAKAFIAECVSRKLTAIAITDHHDIALAPLLQAEGLASDPQVIVYPGLEITLADNAQCLALFDPAADVELPKKLLAMLPGIMPAQREEAKTCAIDPTTWTVKQLFDGVANEPLLRDACIIFPHFGDGDAHKTLNEDGHHTRFAELDCFGVYVEKNHADLHPTTIEKAYGKIEQWGTQRRAILVTGDNRAEDCSRLGHFACWVKLGEPTIEALRQSLLADEARITYGDPRTPTERIERITVHSTLLGEAPVTVTFNAGFNAFIGGRGSGKSAMLEYLRFGLARTERDLGRSDIRGREEELIQQTLENGYVEVVLYRDGLREIWKRDINFEHISITEEDGTQRTLTLDEARRRFRARAFFQKQLSSTTRNLANTADEITGIAAAEELDRRREIDQSIENAKREVGTSLQKAAAHWQTALEREQAKARAEDLKKRIENINNRLKEEGVSPDDLGVIADAPRFSRGKNFLGSIKKLIESERSRVTTLLNSTLSLPMEQFSDVASFPELATLSSHLDETRAGIKAELEAANKKLNSFEVQYSEAAATFGAAEAEFAKKHAEAVAHQSAHKSLIDEASRLAKELATAEELESALASKYADSLPALASLQSARDQLAGLVQRRREVLSAAASQVAEKSSALLKARLKRDPSPKECVTALLELLKGAQVPDAEARCQSWVQSALRDDQDGAWKTICDRTVGIHQAIIASGRPPEPMEEISAKLRELIQLEGNVTARQITKIYQNVTDASVTGILAAVPDDYIVLTYVDDGHDIAFAKASEGQQASALLELLLRQSAGTLIIDQPEDDLDNRVIMRIVELIRNSKSNRQLIFATHNPNLVVNGDADKVIALKSGEQPPAPGADAAARIQLSEDGAIETDAVRDTITRIMEGGKEAFDLRSRKYGFDLARAKPR